MSARREEAKGGGGGGGGSCALRRKDISWLTHADGQQGNNDLSLDHVIDMSASCRPTKCPHGMREWCDAFEAGFYKI